MEFAQENTVHVSVENPSYVNLPVQVVVYRDRVLRAGTDKRIIARIAGHLKLIEAVHFYVFLLFCRRRCGG